MPSQQQVPSSTLLWSAVDRITEPTTRRLHRDERPDEVAATVAELREQDQRAAEPVDSAAKIPRVGYQVPRNNLARYAALSRGHATVPSLWDQSTDALTASNADQAEGKSGSVHRTPCDVDLMETRSMIAETIRVNLKQRGTHPKQTVPAQMRQLASLIAGREPEHVEWWTFRFEQWGRVLAVYLQAVVSQPKPRRIRGVACPECQIRTVVVENESGERMSVPPIVIDFRDGYMRAAECTGCGATLAWRGEEMWQLADRIRGG